MNSGSVSLQFIQGEESNVEHDDNHRVLSDNSKLNRTPQDQFCLSYWGSFTLMKTLRLPLCFPGTTTHKIQLILTLQYNSVKSEVHFSV